MTFQDEGFLVLDEIDTSAEEGLISVCSFSLMEMIIITGICVTWLKEIFEESCL